MVVRTPLCLHRVTAHTHSSLPSGSPWSSRPSQTIQSLLSPHRQCVQAARDEGRVLWATHLHATAAPLEAPLTLPPRLAVVMGSERYGVSDTMRHAADLVRGVEDGEGCRQAVDGNKGMSHRSWLSGLRRRLQVVYLPMYGFVESLNVMVASALVLQVRGSAWSSPAFFRSAV